MEKEKKYFFDSPDNVRIVLHVFYGICLGLLLTDLIYHRHVIHAWESLVGFYGLFGFAACVALVLLAKQMRKVLKRKEDYYDD